MKTRLHHILLTGLLFSASLLRAQDPVADNMLLYQRSNGGWPKHIGETKVDYNKVLNATERAGLVDDKGRNDATIDNSATSKEIRYLLKAYTRSGNKAYFLAAETGVNYLLSMQYDNGGFPQFWPDTSGYRKAITYNDNAMVNALNVLRDVALHSEDFNAFDGQMQARAAKAVEKGIECILKTQVRVGAELKGWCAQHDFRTYAPVKARSFELVSLSGMETVGIVEFLMKVEKPSPAICTSIEGAVRWLQNSSIKGFSYGDVAAPNLPKGYDRLLQPDANGELWARFYDIETNRPFFSGRDGVKKWELTGIEHERRIGYGWYGTWPKNLLQKEYHEWKKRIQHA